MSTISHSDTRLGADDVLTREGVKQLSRYPFLERKTAFDEGLDGVIEQATNICRLRKLKLFRSDLDKKREILGKWYDGYIAIDQHWTMIARNLDEKYPETNEAERRQIEAEYLNYERLNIEGMIQSADLCLAQAVSGIYGWDNHPLRNKLRQLHDAWCCRDAVIARQSSLRVLHP